MSMKKLAPIHPGVFVHELIVELNSSQYRLAQAIGLSPMRISHIVHGRRPITAEVALRLGRYFGQTPQYWLNLQNRYDLDCAADALGKRLQTEVRPLAA